MSSRKTATATRPDDLPNETAQRGLRKVPDLLSESPESSDPTESTDAVVVAATGRGGVRGPRARRDVRHSGPQYFWRDRPARSGRIAALSCGATAAVATRGAAA